MQLLLSCPNQQLDVTQYLDVTEGSGMDPANPSFTEKVFARSLLREGGPLALESFNNRELVFPIKFNSNVSMSAVIQLGQQVNQILNTPGAVAVWQDDGLSQATTFDVQSGQLDVEYNYRAGQQKWLFAKLRLFALPFGRTAQPRAYAAASGVGPLLMISPYVLESFSQSIGASTQASVAGYGGAAQASSGVFYWGNPSLAGDAPALLEISYQGPYPTGATNYGVPPYVAVSVLPDAGYAPLMRIGQEVAWRGGATGSTMRVSTAVASTYGSLVRVYTASPGFSTGIYSFPPSALYTAAPQSWAANHRVFALARASSSNTAGFAATLALDPSVAPYAPTASITPAYDWQLYDLGTVGFRASEALPTIPVNVTASALASVTGCVDVTAFVMLPDNTSWYFNPTTLPSQYGVPPNGGAQGTAPFWNTFLLDDTLADQFLLWGANINPSPVGMSASAGRITPYSRGLLSRPDPKFGMPIIAILGIGQAYSPSQPNPQLSGTVPSSANWIPGGSWANPQSGQTLAQVAVIERTRYVLP